MTMNKNILNTFSNKKPKILFKEPNTFQNYYGKDIADAFVLNGSGQDVFTSHLIQEYDWNTHHFGYAWNSLGLRGPEPDYNANTRILIAGGSNSLGTGIPVESSFPYLLAKKLNANYINLSDVDCLDELVNPLTQFADYDPHYVIINDTRFIQYYGWMMIDLYKTKDIENTDVYKKILKTCDNNFLLLFESHLKLLFPKSKIYLAYSKRRAWKDDLPDFKFVKPILLDKNLIVDMARDNAHPGMNSHKNFTDVIYNSII